MLFTAYLSLCMETGLYKNNIEEKSRQQILNFWAELRDIYYIIIKQINKLENSWTCTT
jgi:hypothetical protein